MREAAAMGEGQEDPGSTPTTTTPTTTTTATTDQPTAGQSAPAGGPATDQASGHQPQEGGPTQEEVTMTTEEEEEEDQEERELIESQGPSRIPVNGLGGTGGRRKGKCKWFNVLKGFGFITPHDGTQDIFVHQSVIQMTGFRSLGEGEEVEFECKPSDKGIEATFVSGPESSDCKGSDRRPMGKKKYKKIRCYNCGDFGNHIAAKCPHGPLPKRCHFCKAEDHLIADCPHRDHTSHPSGQDSDSSPDDAPSNGSSGGGDGTGSSPGGSGTGNGDGGGAAAASEGAESSSSAPAQTTETPAS